MTAASMGKAARVPVAYVAVLVPAMGALNIVGGWINSTLKLPIFLDMIGTMVASVALGPWWGALTGIITNTAASFVISPTMIPFALCNVVGALVWGYGIRSFGMGRSATRLVILGIICGILVQLMASPIVVFVFGGATGHSSDALVAAFAAAGNSLIASSLLAGITGSIADKMIATFVGLAILRALPPGLTAGIELPKSEGQQNLMLIVGGVVLGVILVLLSVFVVTPALSS
ncbi:MAG: hypothetical protein RL338_377 [Chloroflexota bacterium]|jgi:energy-coupling factor transport system substrate-specific component